MDTEHQNQEYERDEQLLEARRLKRLEQKRKRKMQQRIVLGVLLIILVLIIVLVVKGCRSDKTPVEEAPEEQQPSESEQLPTVQTEPDTVVTLAAVGDIMMYDEQLEDAKQEDGTYDFTSCFSAVSGLTASADITVGNLELNFCGEPYSGYPDFRAPEVLADTLRTIGFDVLQTANTYSIMNGISGLESTLRYLDTAGLSHVGTYASAEDKQTNGGVLLKNVNGVKIAFIGFTKGVNNLTLPEGSEYAVDLLYTDYSTDYSKINSKAIVESVESAKALNPDVIVAMVHWGSEYSTSVDEGQEQITTLLLENGVDVILGSHSHIVGKMEQRSVTTVDGENKTCFVAYSLGNFCAIKKQDYTNESVILNLEFTKNGETGKTSVTNISYTPLYIIDTGEEAADRFQVLPVRSAITSGLFDEQQQALTDAIAHLRSNSASDYDSGK